MFSERLALDVEVKNKDVFVNIRRDLFNLPLLSSWEQKKIFKASFFKDHIFFCEAEQHNYTYFISIKVYC